MQGPEDDETIFQPLHEAIDGWRVVLRGSMPASLRLTDAGKILLNPDGFSLNLCN